MKYEKITPFPSLAAGLSYKRYCPLCHHGMEIYDARTRHEYNFAHERTILTLELDQHAEHVLHIDLMTEQVELVISKREDYMLPVYGDSPSSIYYNSRMGTAYIRLDGEMANSIHIQCMNRDCSQYSYVLQMWINLDMKRVTEVYLNSEFIAFDEGQITHELKNIYTTGKTIYTYYDEDGSMKSIPLPLVELNVSKPSETLERVKNLLIFS